MPGILTIGLTAAGGLGIVAAMNDTPDSPVPAPFESTGHKVLPAWIDGNDHMNVAWYLRAFDDGFDTAYEAVGLGYGLIKTRGFSTMSVDIHVSYHRELLLDAPLRITTQLVDHDAKRMHWMQAMYHAEEGYLAATAEWLILFIDMTRRKVAAMPDDILARIAAVKAAHAALPLPVPLGRTISIHNRKG
ncbi:MAG: thioesterase family protein [Rhodospirillaceae bacterium]|nr:thioesterase family protein [Rhodospirillaceae bacterium]